MREDTGLEQMSHSEEEECEQRTILSFKMNISSLYQTFIGMIGANMDNYLIFSFKVKCMENLAPNACNVGSDTGDAEFLFLTSILKSCLNSIVHKIIFVSKSFHEFHIIRC
jgi:hypothetical protein